MKQKIYLPFILLLLLSVNLLQCGFEKKEAVLKLKFNENQTLRWSSSSKSHTEYFENDSLVSVNNDSWESESVERVLNVIDKNTARLKLTYYYEKEKRNKKDTSKIIMVKDSSSTEYIQDIHAVNLDIFPYDTSSIERIEYVKKLYEQLAPHYPSEPVSNGYKWSNNVKVMLQDGETNNAITTYTIKEFVKEAGYDCVIIEFKGNTIVPFQVEYICKESNGKTFETRIDKRKTEGTTYFAYKNGFIVKESYSYEYLSEGTKTTPNGEVKTKTVSNGSNSYILIEASGI